MEPILLASSSPRRRELLSDMGIHCTVFAPDIDESVHDHEIPAVRVVRLAEEKAHAALRRLKTDTGFRLLLAADTLVAVEESDGTWTTEGKPTDRADAGGMLLRLAGKTHVVFSGICLADRETGIFRTRLSETRVSFARLDPAEIEAYLDTGEWEGAAGAYRLQGRGSFIIERIEGSWSGVVGLPLRELYGILNEAGYRFAER